MAETGWTLSYETFEPAAEGLREALCTLGNGCFATRGAAEEAEADEVHYPGTYLAGGYNRRVTELAGRNIENEDLVNLPNWLPLSFRPEGGDWLNLRRLEILDYAQELDLRQGMLIRRMRVRDGEGRETAVTSRRIVHMACTARRIGGISSGTSCSSCPISTSTFPRSAAGCCSTGIAGSMPRGGWRARRGVRAPCTRGRAARTAGRRPRFCT